MNDSMRHRGPDGEGFWEVHPNSRGWGPMLAHRRLSILDLSAAAAQPMVDHGTGDALVLNGEIYNYVALRAQLRASGKTIQSSGDTEVMLRLLSLGGVDAIQELRGMFAFAFWSALGRELVLARDPLGIKPLYIARNPDRGGDWSVAFASEVRALLASGLLKNPKLRPEAVESVVSNGFMIAPHTVVAGIESLMPGELRVLDDSGSERYRKLYWSIVDGRFEEPATEHDVARSLEDSVRLHLASDVPLGIFLSGGIDSSAMANIAHRVSDSPVHTFTLAFNEQQHNEGVHSRRIAEAIGTQHSELLLTEDRFLAGLDSALKSLDQPTFDGLNTYFISQAVRDAGFTVALAGSGGDELFGGYTSFRDLPKLMYALGVGKWVPKALQSAAAQMFSSLMVSSRGGFPPQTRWAKLPEMVTKGPNLISLYQIAYSLFLPSTQRELLGDARAGMLVDGLPEEMRRLLEADTRGIRVLPAISAIEQRIFLGERLLRDTDAVSMAASIEIRLPLVDQILLQDVGRLPDSSRYQPIGKKALLRRVGLRGLDPQLFDRPKSGFVLPYDQWMRNVLRSELDEVFGDSHAVQQVGLNPKKVLKLWHAFREGAPGLYWSRVWSLYVYIRWCQSHSVFI